MSKAICPVPGCHKKFVNGDFLAAHLCSAHPDFDLAPRRRGWATPYGFGDWAEPITYAEACERMKQVTENFWPKQQTQESTSNA